jgi:hypothetical protein
MQPVRSFSDSQFNCGGLGAKVPPHTLTLVKRMIARPVTEGPAEHVAATHHRLWSSRSRIGLRRYPSDRTRLVHEWLLAAARHVEVDLIRWIWAFIDRPLERFDQAAAFWANVTDTRLSTRRGSDGEFVTLLPLSGHPSLKLQGVHGSGGAHLDLEVAGDPGPCATYPGHSQYDRKPGIRYPQGTTPRGHNPCCGAAPMGIN